MSEVFRAKQSCKMSDLFRQFLLALRLSDDVLCQVQTTIKRLYARNNVFKKRITNMGFSIIYILVQNSFLGDFFQDFLFNFPLSANHGGQHLYSAPPFHHHKKVSYSPAYNRFPKYHVPYTAQNIKFSIEDFFSKCDQSVCCGFGHITEEILNGKLQFLCCVILLDLEYSSEK